MLKVKLVLAVLVSILPFNALRLLGYRLLGYKISGRIGFGTVIAVAEARIEKAKIGAFNLFVGPMTVRIGEGTSIGMLNIFTCGFWTALPENERKRYARALTLGAGVLMTSGNYFDLAGAFTMGDRTWVGVGSQFWTHGAGATDRNIQIGRDCYIGSAVRFAPGSAVGENTIVALGSVVTKRFTETKVMLGGVPAAVLKENYDWREEEEN